MKIALTNLGAYNDGELIYEWLELHCTDEQIQDCMKRIGVDGVHYEEYFVTDYECDFLDNISEYENIDTLNELAEVVDDNNAIKAILEHEGLHYWRDDLEGLIRHAEEAVLIPDIDTHEELGQYLVDAGYIDVPEHLLSYLDYEAIGRDWDYNSTGGITNFGYLML